MEAILDFETRSKAPLDEVGAIEYAKHPSTSIFCLGFQVDDDEPGLWIPERAPMPEKLWSVIAQGGILIAHNAAFERAITRHTLTRYKSLTSEQRYVLGVLPPSRWRCLAAKAAMASLPRKLETVTQVLKLPIQKDTQGNKLVRKYGKPRRPSKNNPALWWTNSKDLRRIYRYCLTDIKVERALHDELPDLSVDEQKVWELDQTVNDRGVRIDIPTVKTTLRLVAEETANITKRVQKLSQGEVASASQVARMLKWVNARGAKLANLQAPTIRDRLLDEDLNSEVRQMLEYRQEGSKTSTAKYLSMLHAVGDDDRARELLLYCGAIPTARWAGKRIQPQNFPRPTIKNFNSDEAIELIKQGQLNLLRERFGENKVMNVLSSSIRGMLIASPGSEFYCADFAAVEARLAFWLAEHDEGVRAFLEKRKLYEEMASEAFNIPIEEITKESLERFVGKESVLGCQYGMGWAKFLRNCHQKGVKQVTAEMAKRAVYTYRRIHHPIPEFWGAIEKACIRAIKNPGEKFRATKVVCYTSGHWLNIRLPSGRKLRYFHPTLSQKQTARGDIVPEIRYWTMDSFTHQWVRTSIWGGVFTNHIVQGMARDLMVNAVQNIENAGYSFLLSVHDEGLSEREKGLGSVEEYIKLMTRLPKWAEGAPIEAEGWSGQRYRK